jgi:hypothetical protein
MRKMPAKLVVAIHLRPSIVRRSFRAFLVSRSAVGTGCGPTPSTRGPM